MKYLIGFLAGTVFGAAAALLYAPERGEDLRLRLRTEAESRYQQIQDQVQKGMTQLQDQVDKLSGELQTAVDQTKKTGS